MFDYQTPAQHRRETSDSTAINEPQASNNKYQRVLEYFKANEPYQTALKQDGISFSEVQRIFKEQISDFDYKKQGFSQWKKFLNSVIQGTEFEIVKSGSNNSIAKLKIG